MTNKGTTKPKGEALSEHIHRDLVAVLHNLAQGRELLEILWKGLPENTPNNKLAGFILIQHLGAAEDDLAGLLGLEVD